MAVPLADTIAKHRPELHTDLAEVVERDEKAEQIPASGRQSRVGRKENFGHRPDIKHMAGRRMLRTALHKGALARPVGQIGGQPVRAHACHARPAATAMNPRQCMPVAT